MATAEPIKLPDHFNLEPELREQLSTRPGHQRCIEGAGELLLVVHEVPRPGDPGRDPLFFWRSHDGAWRQAAGPGLGSGAGLGGLTSLLDRYEETLDGRQEALAAAASAAAISEVLRHAGPLARTSGHLVQALEQALAIDPDDRAIRNCRDRAREIERAADLLLGDGRLAIECRQAAQIELLAGAATQLNRSVWRLKLLVAVFLPLAALGAWFGMDVPPSIKPWFWVVLLGAAAVAVLVQGLAGCRSAKRAGRED